MNNKIRIGSRGSKLAVTQAETVATLLKAKNPDLTISFHHIKTTGDQTATAPLTTMGGKGVFVKEIEEALLNNEIDLAVHSLKDLPQQLPAGLSLGPCPKREEPNDAFVSRFGELLKELPRGSTIGTSSPRRQAQLLHRFKKKYRVENLRGNVETRLEKVKKGDVDGALIALAGVKRLGLESEITEILDTADFLPAPCQGCLGLEYRTKDDPILTFLRTIADETSDLLARAERAFLLGIGGSCTLPVAGLASLEEGHLVMRAAMFDLAGEMRVDGKEEGPVEFPELVGGQCAERLLHDGGSEIIFKLEELAAQKKG